MKIRIPSPLQSYTGSRRVDAAGATLAEVLDELDRRYPGFRFRVVDEQDHFRRHIRFFVNGDQTFDLKKPLAPTDAIDIVQALSGG